MPSKITIETEEIAMDDVLDTSAGSKTPKKIKEKKVKKTKVPEPPVEDLVDECEPPAPKKKKKKKDTADQANGHTDGSIDASIDMNGNTSDMNNTSVEADTDKTETSTVEEATERVDEVEPPKKKKKKKKDKEDQPNGHTDASIDMNGNTSVVEADTDKTEEVTNARVEEETAPVEESEPLSSKKKKKKRDKADQANAHTDESVDMNGNAGVESPLKMKITSLSTEEENIEADLDKTEKKKKKKEKQAVNGPSPTTPQTNGHSTVVTPATTPDQTPNDTPAQTPAPSSEDSDSEKDTETPEQIEGAFSKFRISPQTIKLLQARGVSYLFDIQVKTFDSVYDGKDVIGQARTGTGKTFSFAVPLVEKLQADGDDQRRGRAPKVLVLTPTRELAIQVARDFKDVTRKLSLTCFYGGSSYHPQLDAIRKGIDILVGTPGRIKDHLQNNKLDLSQLKHVVLDEVDQMLDMGFAEQVEEILCASYKKDGSENPQTLLFSATCPPWVYEVAKKYMRPQYEHVDLIGKKTKKTATTVEHLAIACHWSQRAAVIGDVLKVYSGSHGRTIVFCETKRDVDEHSAAFSQSAQCLHGDIPQKQRELTLKGFRNGAFEVLVATNVAARGLDIPEVDLVVQCSPPKDVESYIHRSGRTGRAGRTGVCICFYQRKEEDQLRNVERKAGIVFKRIGVPTANDIIKSSSKDAVRFLDTVPTQAIEYFRASAEQLIAERGAVTALAAALAHISGATSLEQRSLLNSDAGYTTMQLTCSQEMHSISLAWRTLKEQLGEELDGQAQRMTFLKGKMGVCFDVPAAKVKEYQDAWQDGRRWQLSIAMELPELEERQWTGGDRSGGGGGSWGGGGRGGNRGNGFRNGGGGGSWRGGQKRSFSHAFDR